MNLPKFIKYEIFKQADFVDIVLWQRTSKYWYNFLKQIDFWLIKLKHDYPDFDLSNVLANCYFDVFRALTLKYGHLHDLEHFRILQPKLRFPYDAKQKTIYNFISIFRGSSYIVNEHGQLYMSHKSKGSEQIFDRYVDQDYTEIELEEPFLKNISNIKSIEDISYILTNRGDLYELAKKMGSHVPDNLCLTLGSKHISISLIENAVKEIGQWTWRWCTYGLWYLTNQNVLNLNIDGKTYRFDHVLHVSIMTDEDDQTLCYADTNYNIWQLKHAGSPKKIYSSNFAFTQFSINRKNLYLIDNSNTLHVMDLVNFEEQTLRKYEKLFYSLRSSQIYGLKSNLDLILLPDLSLVAKNVVNVITTVCGSYLVILASDYFMAKIDS